MSHWSVLLVGAQEILRQPLVVSAVADMSVPVLFPAPMGVG